MATSKKATSTRNRRQGTPKGKPGKATPRKRTAKADASAVTANKVVARRLAILPDAKRQQAAKRFAAGESIKVLASEFDLSITRATYCIKQELVENGTVDRLPASITVAQIKQELNADKHGDWAFLACRTGLTPQRLQAMVSDAS